MLRNLYEWYRIVTAKPDDETIRHRQASIPELVDRLVCAESFDLLVGCTAAASNGLNDRNAQPASLVPTLVEIIRKHQPAFPQDLSENALDLRACCAVALGEMLIRPDAEKKKEPVLVASLLLSANSLRPVPSERYLKVVLDGLLTLASELLERAALLRRNGATLPVDRLSKLEAAADVAAFQQQVVPAILDCFNELQRRAITDREERELLWWLYAGSSSIIRKRVSVLKPAVAAVCCGGELANIAIQPPLASIRHMVYRAVEEGRKAKDLAERSVEDMVPDWDENVLRVLAPGESRIESLISAHPSLLPLSWLCKRLSDSQVGSGWKEEFELKTGFSPTEKRPTADWAAQVFHERSAQRLLAD
ncbi:MAG: GTPase-associated system all-helical protein GASH [Thermoguttaceae bacterium]